MGNRLVIVFTENAEPVVSLYQHWSANTVYVLDTLVNISSACHANNVFQSNEKVKPLLESLLSFGFIEEAQSSNLSTWLKYFSLDEISAMSNRTPTISKHVEGLITLFPTNLEDTLEWTQMLVTIPLETMTFDLYALYFQLTADTFDDEEDSSLFDDGTDTHTFETLLAQAKSFGLSDNILSLSDTTELVDMKSLVGSCDGVFRLNEQTNEVLCLLG